MKIPARLFGLLLIFGIALGYASQVSAMSAQCNRIHTWYWGYTPGPYSIMGPYYDAMGAYLAEYCYGN